jgi:hypothetical protein
MGKIIFWSTLFTITDMQINKEKKLIRINFYAEDKKLYKQLRLIMENVLFFREALVKRMSNLKIKIEANKLIKGQLCEKRLTSKDINLMNINEIEDYIKLLLKKIEHNQINFYIINTFSTLCGKEIEYYSKVVDKLLNLHKEKNLPMPFGNIIPQAIMVSPDGVFTHKDLSLIEDYEDFWFTSEEVLEETMALLNTDVCLFNYRGE